MVRFYAQRDTEPQKWYPRGANGAILKFDDLPPEYHGNLDAKAPFDREAGGPPALSEADIKDIVVFLNALTDGYDMRRSFSPPPVPAF